MTSSLNAPPGNSVNKETLDSVSKMARNSVAMLMVATFDKGAGLIVATLVARYLGPSTLGILAVVMGLALLFETIAPLGQQQVVIRSVARNRSHMFSYWINASLVTVAFSVVLSVILVVLAHLVDYDAAILGPIHFVSLFLPLAGLYLIARAILQGMERMEYLTIAAFVGRVIGLLLLWVLLRAGVGVVAAFIGRGLFQLTSLLVLAWVILRHVRRQGIVRDWHPDLDLCRTTLHASFHFATQDFLTVALTRVNAVILPLLITMKTVGMFDAADRVRQTSAMIIPAVMMTILPTLSRTFITDQEKAIALTGNALKLLLIIIFPFAFVVTVGADQIISLLYGSGYEAAVPVLQIVIWSQVFFVADSVLNQVMIASNNERPMVRRTGLSVAASVVLTLLLAPRYGAPGVAWAAILTRALNLGLDAQFVTKNVFRINLIQTAGKPFLCAALSGALALVLRSQSLCTLLLLTVGSYVALLLSFQVFSPDELLVLRRLSRRWLNKVGRWKTVAPGVDQNFRL